MTSSHAHLLANHALHDVGKEFVAGAALGDHRQQPLHPFRFLLFLGVVEVLPHP